MRIAGFIWWLGAAALVIPFLDVVWSRPRWLQRATAARVILALVEVGTLVAWWFLRGWQFLPEHDLAVALAGAVLALTGGLLSAWSRARLGRLFSPHLGVQKDHELVTSGPYALVRHPMYLGIIDFIIGSALYWNDVALLIVGLLFILYFTAQLRIEERLFERHFGAEWAAYRERTPALFPRPGRRRPS